MTDTGGYVGRPPVGVEISILLPTRGRAHRLPSAIGTLIAKAAYPARLELLAHIDNDDEPTHVYFDRYVFNPERLGIKAISVSTARRLGYARVFEHYNAMARTARGRFVLLWNDDTDMVTDEWDHLLVRRADAEPNRPLVQFLRRDLYGQADTTLPFIDKRIVDALGGISRHMYTDTWIGEVAAAANVLVWRNDVAYAHHWPQQDATHREGLESVRQSGQHETFKAMVAEKADDVRKINDLIARLGAEAQP